MSTPFEKRLHEIFDTYDRFEVLEGDNPRNHVFNVRMRAVVAIKEAVRELIGEDETEFKTLQPVTPLFARNMLRAKQRLGLGKDTNKEG